MIDISHQQAQRLLRSHLDHHLPNEQWMILQAHLETCETCRIYRDELAGLEKELKRSLRTGWEGMHGPSEDTDQRVMLAFQGRRQNRRKRLIIAGAAALLILVIILLGGPAGIRARFGTANAVPLATSSASQATLVNTPVAAMQPTVEPGQFTDVVVYEGRHYGLPNGDSEIYLLNPGSASIDLTNNTAQDTDPAWSPDGEWLAFLSNRTGKTEVFVTNIAGSRMVQLTDAPGISWYGPLSWSPDGKWIALSGTRDQQGSQNWIYLTAVDGSGVHSLAGSRDGDSPKFSPAGNQIAFHFSDNNAEGIIVQNLDTGSQGSEKWMDNPLVPSPAPGSAFDWSPDGTDLVYLSANPNPVASANQPNADAPLPSSEPGSQVTIVRQINRSIPQYSEPKNSIQVDSSRWPSAFRGATWAPDGAVVYLEDLGDARAVIKPSTQPEGCLTIQVSYASSPAGNGADANRPDSLGGLCVEGGLNQASWSADGRWVVVQGRLPSESRLSIYALRMPTGPSRNTARGARNPRNAAGSTGPSSQLPVTAVPGTILRLSDDRWPGSLPSPRPRSNSSASTLRIDPQPVKKNQASLPTSNLQNSQVAGEISYVVQNHALNVVASANPDGTGGQLLLATLYQIRCPSWSPDGNTIALLQGTGTASLSQGGFGPQNYQQVSGLDPPVADSTSLDNIFVLDVSSRAMRQVSRLNTLPVAEYDPYQVSYSCPVWSPVGTAGNQYLAAIVRDEQKAYLAVLPAGGTEPVDNTPGAQPRYISIDSPDWSQPPVWSPDGKSIFLLHSTNSDSVPGITVVDVPGDSQEPLAIQTYSPSMRLQAVAGLAILPSGKAIIELEINGPAGSAHLHRITFSASGGGSQVSSPVYLAGGQATGAASNTTTTILSGSVTWLYGSTFGITLHAGPRDAVKTMFYLYNLNDDQAKPIAAFEDQVNSTAWSPDGRWLIFSAESGLWGLDIAAASQGKAGPTWISPQPVQDLDWK